ncbi:MAG: hypothetical protein QM597_04360 [Aeromicrobium sp.]|uniref:esterase-like activity of phytase family protein n=1 Tax=Aeromicrobium sp. TaxID=1871063 RepID=UPI0039E41804
MNPRHRRLLIPGLLIALLVVVLVAAIARRADAATSAGTVACVVSDARIDEQSGLAVSVAHPGTAYVVNDSGSDPRVFALDLDSCDVVGVTTLKGVDWRDVEALALDGDGTLWIADTGDNDAVRDDAALYSLDEPGRRSTAVTPKVHPISYETGREDVEALVIDPVTGAKWVVTKGWVGGELLALPGDLPTGTVSEATSTGVSMPLMVTDAAMTPDGRYVLVRNYLKAVLYDAGDDFAEIGEVALPAQSQGETLAVEPDGTTVLVGSEGRDQPLVRVPFSTPQEVAPASPPQDSDGDEARPADADEAAISPLAWAGGVTFVCLLAGTAFALRRRRP